MAGCSALCTISAAFGLGAHLNMVIFCITMSRHAVKNDGTPLELTSLARPYASIGDCEAGVPVIIHKYVCGLSSPFSTFQRVVCGFLYALASSTMIKSKRPSFWISLAMSASPS